jgi:hypothetical protein
VETITTDAGMVTSMAKCRKAVDMYMFCGWKPIADLSTGKESFSLLSKIVIRYLSQLTGKFSRTKG